MKRILKIISIAMGCLLLFIAIVLVVVYFRGIPTYEVQKVEYKAVSSPEMIKRGRKLTVMLCAYCHRNGKTGKLTGTHMREAPKEFGEIYSQNITNDKEYGIGGWTDGELLYLLRTGIKPDGQYIPPYMAKLTHMADEDINAIIAFLRSDDAMVQADGTKDTPSDVSLLTKILCNSVWKPMKMPDKKIELPDSANQIALGKYLSLNLECFSCHSADFKTNDFYEPEKSKGYFGGGNKTLNAEGDVILTSNLTPDKETGIGDWTEEQFIKALKYGVKEGEAPLRYPMVPFTQLTQHEAGAIFAYLKTIKPIHNKVERTGSGL